MSEKMNKGASDSLGDAVKNCTKSSLYFHIPFCRKKCPYCHFYVIPDRPLFQDLLSQALAKEWKQKREHLREKSVVSIYFGGGTPSLFAPNRLRILLDRIREECSVSTDCEITLEVNPEDAKLELFEPLQEMGINRLSFGVQSLDDRSLDALERAHSAKRAKEALFLAQKSGFKNISIDLMYDIPDQTLNSFSYTLDQIEELPICHLSLYNLTIESHTSFYKRRKSLRLPDAALSMHLLERAVATLEKMGWVRYEISAFAKNGAVSRHNLGYWTARPFLGLGPSAFSYWQEERFRNVANIQRYHRHLAKGESPIDFREKLSLSQRMRERLAIYLRLLEGAPRALFDPLPNDLLLSLEKLSNEGLLFLNEEQIRLTEKGLLFYDSVAAEII